MGIKLGREIQIMKITSKNIEIRALINVINYLSHEREMEVSKFMPNTAFPPTQAYT